ncbi:Asp-tRNA(Asn)/Glu-tRNA(Gln) amidotransferase subunit GatA [Candidatus Poriferisodalis sp.]|uniref:Asp-tRNA(Asn)/Glu-tRNA(Gln) amidotransferase subunit GatA n=1 Tax=Candidatus Poriferisodalis sp. TaxID=3101277 RepID=UPI003B015D6B
MNTASAIARDVRSGTRRATDVLEEFLSRIESYDSDVHAFNTVTAEAARAAAGTVDDAVAAGDDPGPLAGVPVAYKDNLCTRGVPTTCSSHMLEGWLPPYDATVVQAMSAAGAVMIGKTNLDEFAMGSSTEHSAFGPTRNPYDLARVPGGSSGGSAAAVASGFAPLALGSDTGGSIRQPASLCGIVGIKPTYGRVSRYGLIAFASSFDQIGPFAVDVADAALALGIISGPDPSDSTSIPATVPDFDAALSRGVEGLRVGVVSELTGTGRNGAVTGSRVAEDAAGEMLAGIDADVTQRVLEAADALAEAGAAVGRVSVPAVTYGLTAYYLIAPAEASSNLARYDGTRYGLRIDGADVEEMNRLTRRSGFGDEVKARIMLGTFALSAGYYDAYYGKAQRVRMLTRRDFDAAYAGYDVLLSPTSPCVAFRFGERADPMTMYRCDTCTIPSNLSGDPAISVPFGTGAADMPVGVQVMAPALGEETMLTVAAAIERSAPELPAPLLGEGSSRSAAA